MPSSRTETPRPAPPVRNARRRSPAGRRVALACPLVLLLAALLPSSAAPHETLPERDRRLLEATFAAMPAQRPGHPDLYVVGVAGDGHQDVFRNEIAWLDALAATRLGARGRVVRLVNHADSFGPVPRPLATVDNLRDALARVGAAMDPDQDLLLLFLTSHGTEHHELVLQLFPVVEARLGPEQLRAALDDAGIRRRVVVVSACYAGGFLPALEDADTLAIAAARHDRTSFGCGSDSPLTWFGRAWMVEGLNQGADFIAAFEHAAQEVARREQAEGYPPSLPQMAVGSNITPVLRAWHAALPPAAPLPDPYPEPTVPAFPGRTQAGGATSR